MRAHNLFTDAEPPHEGERFDALLRHKNLVVERIVSSSVITPREYVQPQDEWVLLVKGEAVLHVAGEPVTLRPGDHLFLPAGVPHTVERASHGAMWLAVHLHPDPERSEAPGLAWHTDTHAAEIVRNLGEQRKPLVITQNGEPAVVLRNMMSPEFRVVRKSKVRCRR